MQWVQAQTTTRPSVSLSILSLVTEVGSKLQMSDGRCTAVIYRWTFCSGRLRNSRICSTDRSALSIRPGEWLMWESCTCRGRGSDPTSPCISVCVFVSDLDICENFRSSVRNRPPPHWSRPSQHCRTDVQTHGTPLWGNTRSPVNALTPQKLRPPKSGSPRAVNHVLIPLVSGRFI